MTARVALVTGGNQGLGLALVRGLGAALEASDTVYLAARDPERGRAAIEALAPVTPQLDLMVLDVSEEESVRAAARTIADRHGGIDIVLQNAAARIHRETPQSAQVRQFVATNNLGTTRMLRHFLPLLRSNARFVTVASSFGSLTRLPTPLHARFNVETASFDDIDAVMVAYAEACETGTAEAEGWPDWINTPSKVGQVAATMIAARQIAEIRPGARILINAVCPGLIDTAASRPWFDDMSSAQTPDAAAVDLLWLALLPEGSRDPAGELVRNRKPLPWK